MDEPKKNSKKNIHAVALGKIGGKRRSELMTVQQRIDVASKGGLVGGRARADALTKARRSEIAKKAVEARWAKEKKGRGRQFDEMPDVAATPLGPKWSQRSPN